MQVKNVPATGPRYWTALSIASVFGANMGDFFSHNLHLGHSNGLLPLAVAFVLILVVEHRSKPTTEAFYWVAIVTLRTAATNMGDLLTHDFKIPYEVAMAGLAVLLFAVLLAEAQVRKPASGETTSRAGVPDTNLFYWAAMMTAGTLGTAAGDYVADILDLGVGFGSIALCAILAIVLSARTLLGLFSLPSYWITIVAVRSAGTTVGDYLAGRHGLALGLPVSTACSGILLVAVLVVSSRVKLWRTAAAA